MGESLGRAIEKGAEAIELLHLLFFKKCLTGEPSRDFAQSKLSLWRIDGRHRA